MLIRQGWREPISIDCSDAHPKIGMNAKGTYNRSGGVVEVAYNTPKKVYVYAYGKIAYDQMRLGSQLYTIDIKKTPTLVCRVSQ